MTAPPPGQDDPIRLFRGAPATFADIEAGWIVPRTVLLDGHASLSFPLFVDQLSSTEAGTTWVLQAPPGEGKTTFLTHLAFALRDVLPVLRWGSFDDYDPDLLNNIVHDLDTRVLLLVELSPTDTKTAIAQTSEAIGRNPPPCPFLIAAREREASLLTLHHAHDLVFGPRDLRFAQDLIDRLRRAAADRYVSAWNVERDLPHLARFLDNPEPALFLTDPAVPSTRQPLFAGLLRALFGFKFRERFVHEYKDLPREAAAIYRWVLFTQNVGLPMPMRLLSRLFPTSDVTVIARQHSRGTPWHLDVDTHDMESLISRHVSVAEALTFDLSFLTADNLKYMFSLFFDVLNPCDDSLVRLGADLIGAYARLRPVAEAAEPIAGGPRPPGRGILLGTLRNVIKAKSLVLRQAREFCLTSDDWGVSGHWAATLHHLIPDSGGAARRAARFLFDEIGEWQRIALARFPPRLQSHARYWAEKNRLERATLDGRAIDVESATLLEWTALFNEGSKGLPQEFYLAVAELVFLHAREDRVANRGDAFTLAGQAYCELFAGRDTDHDFILMKFRTLLDWATQYLTRDAVTQLLKTCWERTGDRQIMAHAEIGTWYAESLFATPDGGQMAIGVLKSVLSYRPWGEALLLLAEHGELEFSREYLTLHPIGEEWRNAMNRALGYFGAAMLAEPSSGREVAVLYQKACEEFAVAFEHRTHWSRYCEQWRIAIERLNREEPEFAGRMKSALRAYERTVRLK